jgi:hypothetical protein
MDQQKDFFGVVVRQMPLGWMPCYFGTLGVSTENLRVFITNTRLTASLGHMDSLRVLSQASSTPFTDYLGYTEASLLTH